MQVLSVEKTQFVNGASGEVVSYWAGGGGNINAQESAVLLYITMQSFAPTTTMAEFHSWQALWNSTFNLYYHN